MNGPQHFGAPPMPKKPEKVPSWSDEDLEIAKEFHNFLKENASLPKEGYHQKQNRLVRLFAEKFHEKYFCLKGVVHRYEDLPPKVRSAFSKISQEINAQNKSTRADKRIEQKVALLQKVMLKNVNIPKNAIHDGMTETEIDNAS